MTLQDEMNKTEMDVFVELYKLKIGNETLYYTSFDEPILFKGNYYKAVTIDRDPIKEDSQFAPARINVKVEIGEQLSKYISSAPADNLRIIIIRFFIDANEDYIIFSGKHETITLSGQLAILSFLSDPEIHIGKIPRYVFQSQCNHLLFSEGCGLDENLYKTEAIITVGQKELTSSTFATKPDGYFTGGYAKYDASIRMIVKHEGDKCYIHAPFDDRVKDGSAVTVYPGCKRDETTCINKFNNHVHFLGMPTIPASNPTIWGLQR